MSKLWSFKGYALHVLVVVICFLNPSVRDFLTKNPMYAMVGAAVWGGILHWANGKLSAPKNGTLAAVVALFFLSVPLHAQTAPVTDPFTSLENGYPITVTGNYSASSGNATNNGVQTTLEYRLAKHIDARVDQFGLNKPSATMLSLAEVQVKYSLAHLVKPTANFNSKPILLSLHAGPGALKSPGGAASFAVGAGVSIDYVISKIMHVRVLDYTYAYSRGLGNAGISIGNYSSVGTGLGFSF